MKFALCALLGASNTLALNLDNTIQTNLAQVSMDFDPLEGYYCTSFLLELVGIFEKSPQDGGWCEGARG